jgi:predicted nuclease of predicted toxin-antitoxin system
MNLPPAIADRLRAEGHDAVHALEAGFSNMLDAEIFAQASQDRHVVVTFDLDFGEIVGAAMRPRSGVILLRLRRARQSYLWDRLRVGIAEAGDALEAGAIVLVEDARIRIRRMGPEA